MQYVQDELEGHLINKDKSGVVEQLTLGIGVVFCILYSALYDLGSFVGEIKVGSHDSRG